MKVKLVAVAIAGALAATAPLAAAGWKWGGAKPTGKVSPTAPVTPDGWSWGDGTE